MERQTGKLYSQLRHLLMTHVCEINDTQSQVTRLMSNIGKGCRTWGLNGLQLHYYRADLSALLIFVILYRTPITAKVWDVSFGVDPRCWGL